MKFSSPCTCLIVLLTLTTHAPCTATTPTPQDPPSAEPAGFVTEIEGDWWVEQRGGRGAARGGQGVEAGATVSATGESAEARIRIACRDGRVEVYKRPGNYQRPVTPCKALNQEVGTWQRVQAVFARFFAHGEEEYVPTLGRSFPGAVALQEAVLVAKSGGLDLAPLFVRAGERPCPLQVEHNTGAAGKLKWQQVGRTPKDTPCPPIVDPLPPGLYRIRLVKEGQVQPTDAWFFVASAADASRLRQVFGDVKAAESWWGEGLEEDQKRGRLRALLHMLSEDKL